MPEPIKKDIGKFLTEKRREARERGVIMGMPKGTKTKKTIEKEKALKLVNQMIMKRADTLVRAGMSVALGQNFVYRIDEEKNNKGKVLSRKHILIVDPDEIATALDQMEEGATHPNDAYYYVTAKEPDHKAIEMLLNRAFGKPKESLSVEGEIKFSLKNLGKKADDLETLQVKEVSYIEKPPEPTSG